LWTPSTVRNVLTNEDYYGVTFYNITAGPVTTKLAIPLSTNLDLKPSRPDEQDYCAGRSYSHHGRKSEVPLHSLRGARACLRAGELRIDVERHQAPGVLELEPASPTDIPGRTGESGDVLPVQGVLSAIRACAGEKLADRQKVSAHLAAAGAVVAVRPGEE